MSSTVRSHEVLLASGYQPAHLSFCTRYTSRSSRELFFVFTDEQQHERIFDGHSLLLITREQLRIRLNIAQEQKEFETPYQPSVRHIPVTFDTFINRLLGFRRLSVVDSSINRLNIFQSWRGYMAIPLFDISTNSKNRINNAVYWKGRARYYFNSNNTGMNLQIDSEPTQAILITSNPNSKVDPSLNTTPDAKYAHLILHPDAQVTTFNFVKSLGKFSLFALQWPTDHIDRPFFCRWLTYLLAELDHDYITLEYFNSEFLLTFTASRETDALLSKLYKNLSASERQPIAESNQSGVHNYMIVTEQSSTRHSYQLVSNEHSIVHSILDVLQLSKTIKLVFGGGDCI
jgi:hypothetical protein